MDRSFIQKLCPKGAVKAYARLWRHNHIVTTCSSAPSTAVVAGLIQHIRPKTEHSARERIEVLQQWARAMMWWRIYKRQLCSGPVGTGAMWVQASWGQGRRDSQVMARNRVWVCTKRHPKPRTTLFSLKISIIWLYEVDYKFPALHAHLKAL